MPEYNKSDRIRKLQKLYDLANHDATEKTLARNSRAVYERLLEQWEIDPSALESEEETVHEHKYPRGCLYIASHIAVHLGLVPYNYPGRRSSLYKIYFKATATDNNLFENLFSATLRHLERKRKRMEHEIYSYMSGVMHTQYPGSSSKLCIRCDKETYEYSASDDQFVCGSCGYKGRKSKSPDIDPNQFLWGSREGHGLKKPSELIEHKAP